MFIALTKNTSLAAAFGIAEATFRMRGLTNDYASERIQIFLGIALGYIIIVETDLIRCLALRAPLGGG